jgi:ribosomal protein S9
MMLMCKVKAGVSSQMDVIRLAIAKALCNINGEYRQVLNQNLL